MGKKEAKNLDLHIHLILYKNIFYYFFFQHQDGKTGVKNLDLKIKLSIVSSTIANVKKDIKSFKNEFNDFKSDHAMSKKGLNSLNDEFYDQLIKSSKVNDNLVNDNLDILMIKNEYYVNIRNKSIINNDTLITKTNCIKLKSMV